MEKPSSTESGASGETVLLVLCTCPEGGDSAQRLADALVKGRLAACVNIIPGLRSLFHWEGRLEQERECLLLAKTTRGAWPRLERELLALHPYSVPEILAIPLAHGQESYLSWVRASCSGAPAQRAAPETPS